MAALEASASGVPVIASRIGSLEELVVPEQPGVLFAPGNAHDLATQVRRLLSDTALQARIRRATLERHLTAFSPEHSLEALLALYRELSSGPDAARPATPHAHASMGCP